MTSNSKGCLELGLLKHLDKSTVILYRSDKTKDRDFELPKVARCLKVNILRKFMGEKG